MAIFCVANLSEQKGNNKIYFSKLYFFFKSSIFSQAQEKFGFNVCLVMIFRIS